MYAIFGLVHAKGAIAAVEPARDRLASERGQGTVEYVGLVLLVAALMGGMVAAVGGLGSLSGIGKELAEAITKKIVQGVQKITLRLESQARRPPRAARVRASATAGRPPSSGSTGRRWQSAAMEGPPRRCGRSRSSRASSGPPTARR